MTLRERLSKLAEEWARSGEPRPQSGSAKPYPPSYHLARKEDAATLLAALRASEDAPAPASPRPEEPGRCVALDGMPGCSQPPVPGTRLCWAHGGDLVASPRAQPEAPRCGGCGYLPSFDSVEQGVYAPSGEPCPGCPDCAGRSSQPEVKP